jgi:Zn-dependent protease with chaperone function
MYLLRGLVLSLDVFFLAYVASSAMVAVAWGVVGRKYPLRSDTALYLVRIIPVLGACGLVSLFAAPSYLHFEPRFTNETIGVGAFALALGGAVVLVTGCVNTLRAWLKTSHFVVLCLQQTRQMKTRAAIPVYEVASGAPTVFVTGVWRPKLQVSSAAVALLDSVEIEAAIQHEVAHANRRDNLKKLVLRLCPCPLLAPLEREWLKAAEIAADDAAVWDENSALALAAALVKISRASMPSATPELAMTLVPETGSPLRDRVERLLYWKPRTHRRTWLFKSLALASTTIVLGLHYSWALTRMHQFTEFLFR